MKYKFDYWLAKNGDADALYIDGNLIGEIRLQKGIATLDNHSTGGQHSCHPNIDASGSLKGMVSRGYWNATDKIVKTGGAFYNVSKTSISDCLDFICFLVENNQVSHSFFHNTATSLKKSFEFKTQQP